MTSTAMRVIRDEHQAVAAVLRSLKMLVKRSHQNGVMPPFDVLRAMIFYVDEFPERLHHTKETELLFPRVRARRPGSAPSSTSSMPTTATARPRSASSST